MADNLNDRFSAHIRWCPVCAIPVIQPDSHGGGGEGRCPLCSGETTRMARDVRPVFPEERLLLALLLGKPSAEYQDKPVWCEDSRYFVGGKGVPVAARAFERADCKALKARLEENRGVVSYEEFDLQTERFCRANQTRLRELIDEAHGFIRETAAGFPEENVVLSFSGGKDSSVVTDLATRALGNPSLVHIYGDTTLEFPQTREYAARFRKAHPFAIFQTARNDDRDFMDVCADIGPPARMMRWCCSMFKTGPISRVLGGLYRNQRVLTFYGIRSAESVSRSKYNRVESDRESVKILRQTVASPILHWKDIDVWLYLLSENVDFNDAYRLGYDRVGCWCCPNNNQRAQFLSRIYMAERAEAWRTFLVGFAKRIGKGDPEVYVDSGAWKARQGGNGLPASEDVKIRFTNCTAEEHAKSYSLVRPFDDGLAGLFTPFGIVSKELGSKLLSEVVVLDAKTNVPVVSLQPFAADGFRHAVKVKTMNVSDHDGLQRKIAYQIRKFNACRKCLKCEAVCTAGAITVSADGYRIDPDKCVRCGMCVNQKILENGCLMGKYLRTKETKNPRETRREAADIWG